MSARILGRPLALVLVALQLVLQPLAGVASCAFPGEAGDCCCSRPDAPARPSVDVLAGCCSDEAVSAAESRPARCDCRLAPKDTPANPPTVPELCKVVVPKATAIGTVPSAVSPPIVDRIALRADPRPAPRGRPPAHVLHQVFLL